MSSEFFESLPEEIKNDSTMEAFKDKGPEEVAKAYITAQKTVGKAREGYIPAPPTSNKREDCREYNIKNFGIPESKDGYETNLSEEDLKLHEPIVEYFKDIAAELDLSQKQYEMLLNREISGIKENIGAKKEELKTILEENKEYLLQEWGDNYKENIGGAVRVINKFANDEIKDALKEGRVSKEMMMFASEIAKSISEDKLPENDLNNNINKDELDNQIRTMREKHAETLRNPLSKDFNKITKELQDLYEMRYGK